ncbi:porin [Paraburkholderia caribensis]|uniref:porin n=1 Tax=Paraburkholderia caribensis TaxID=75105 RepID=UPI003AAC6B18
MMKIQAASTGLAGCVIAALFHADVYAQGSVALQGMIDGGITYVNNQHGRAVTLFDSGIFAPNTLTISGIEDLGGGTKAVFNLTSQFDLGSGATIPGADQIFNRTAYVGLSDERLGTVTLGNQYDFMFDTLTLGLFDGAFLFGGLYDFRQGPFSALGVPHNPTGSFDFDRLAGATRVANALKYRSPSFAGFSFGVLYGLGGVAGSFSANSTISAGMNYDNGPLGAGVAYTEARYPELGNGHDAIRNVGAGAHYRFGNVLGMLLYTNTKNTASGAKIDVYKAGAYWTISTAWSAGLDYQYMRGNDVLDNNKAHQVATAVQYHFSKRTMAYVEAVYQCASGDSATTQAWINGLLQPGAAASNRSQTLARIGLQTQF